MMLLFKVQPSAAPPNEKFPTSVQLFRMLKAAALLLVLPVSRQLLSVQDSTVTK